ncbi:hypothetical protein AJ80_05673 [Polytolypa hystricis UAMH7299]|uniref:LysM domain-containing protein n=1 Tax=Polytolypa hystricis (strain UAMH7299) TaxID=1447883 RepID=A0A2B7Y2L1_POLH7|nr:hypothetical protein AJ80_05673 [Polytolypa hystricis UAMH7299]
MNSNTSLLDAFNPSSSSRSTSSNPASAVRPRNRRLISFVDDDDNDGVMAGTGTGTGTGTAPQQQHPDQSGNPAIYVGDVTNSSQSSRTVSPVRGRFPSARPLSRERPSESSRTKNGRAGPRGDNKSGNLGGDFWESSWSSLQGLASAVLGGADGDRGKLRSPAAPSGQQRRKSSPSNLPWNKGSSRSSTNASWGPSSFLAGQVSTGSIEARQALVQARKRQTLLQANGDAMPDIQGNYKRRESGETPRTSSAGHQQEEALDALVYIHHVRPTDSITSVSIRYGCQPATMRKANGFWPSDSIQARKTVLLPVDSCTIRSRRLSPEEVKERIGTNGIRKDSLHESDYFAPHTESSSSTDGNGDTELNNHWGSEAPSVSDTAAEISPPWKHECWVHVDDFPDAVEIGRVPRRSLGFFPRARRKSQVQPIPYSDLDDLQSLSSNVSSAPFNGSPEYRPQPFSPSQSPFSSPSRSRNTSASGSHLRPSYARHKQRNSIVLAGPGGVGTLGRKVTAPGPAPDKLNTFVSTHLPNLVVPPPPPPPPTSVPSNNFHRASMDSTSTAVSASSSTGLENVGGAIEGWVRKMATRARTGLNELQQPGSMHHGASLGIGGMGDLIELDDSLEGRIRNQLLPTEQDPSSLLEPSTPKPSPLRAGNAAVNPPFGLETRGGSGSVRGGRLASGRDFKGAKGD